jgi:hypothetical protein
MGSGRPQEANGDRDAHYQDWLTDPTVFESAEFRCALDPASLKFNKSGSLVVSFIVPPGQIDDALPLRHLIRDRLPLTVTVAVSDEYAALLATQEAYLRLVDDEFSNDSSDFNGGTGGVTP